MATFEDLSKKLSDIGLDLRKSTRVESTDGEFLLDYNPASDIVNLFPTLLAASINDLNSLPDAERKVEVFAQALIDQLCCDSFTSFDGFEFEQSLLKKLKYTRKVYPELYEKLVNKFFVNSFLGYFIANKFGLRTCPEKVGGKGYFHYFALLDFFDDLDEDTQQKLIEDLGHKNLWDVTEEDI